MGSWLLLLLAIAVELFGTSCLKASRGFTRLQPTIGVFAGYLLSFYLLSIVVKTLPVGIVYAIWSGLGTVGMALIGKHFFGDPMPPISWIGVALVVAGVAVLSLSAPGAHGSGP